MDQNNLWLGGKTISAALDELARLLGSDPETVATRASEILDLYPGQAQALVLLVSAFNLMGAEDGAREILAWMSQEHPKLASIQYELGAMLARLGRPREAIAALSLAVRQEPKHSAAWRILANQLDVDGDKIGASRAHARHVKLSLAELELLESGLGACRAEEFAKAERMLRQVQAIAPTDVTVARLLGELHLRVGRLKDAEIMLERALDLAPRCTATRDLYCLSLTQQMDWVRANAQLNILLNDRPDDHRIRAQLAGNLAMLGERQEALRVFDGLRVEMVEDAAFWLSYAQAARVIGKDSATIVDAYRASLTFEPSYGAAWWGLADLKTYHFSPSEISTMQQQLKRDDIADGLRCHIEFALGKALEDEGKYGPEVLRLMHYEKGNALRRAYISYDASEIRNNVMVLRDFFTTDFFAARKETGCLAPDPIFIVGMPRSGSTLIEQILSSHSEVEGTMEFCLISRTLWGS